MRSFNVSRIVRDEMVVPEHEGDEGVRCVDNQEKTFQAETAAGAKALRCGHVCCVQEEQQG